MASHQQLTSQREVIVSLQIQAGTRPVTTPFKKGVFAAHGFLLKACSPHLISVLDGEARVSEDEHVAEMSSALQTEDIQSFSLT